MGRENELYKRGRDGMGNLFQGVGGDRCPSAQCGAIK